MMEFPNINSNRLRNFATTLFESVGGVVEPVEDDLIEVLLPEEMDGWFRSNLQIAFDPEIAQEAPGSALLTYGSPLLDDLVAFAGEQGNVSRVYLTGLNLDDSNLEHNLKRGMRFEGGELRIDRVKVNLFKYLLFSFKVRYTTDEHEEELISIGVNMHNGQIARRLMSALKDAGRYAEENYLICPEAPSISIHQAYHIAREEVERKMIASLHLRQAAIEKMIRHESERINKFYRDNETELMERVEKERIKSERTEDDHLKSEERIRALLSKRQVNEIERKRRIQEMLDKHTLRTSVRLINLLQIAYPKMVISARVVDKESKRNAGDDLSATATIIWDAFTQSPEPPMCSKCGKTTTTLNLVRPPRSDAKLVCGTC